MACSEYKRENVLEAYTRVQIGNSFPSQNNTRPVWSDRGREWGTGRSLLTCERDTRMRHERDERVKKRPNISNVKT